MSSLTCPEVEPHLDLYAAGACDPPTAAAVRAHLAVCPDCARAHEQARQLIGLLDLRFREPAGLERLRQRIEANAPRRTRPGVLPFLRRAVAVAALVLVSVGIATLPGTRQPADAPVLTAIVWASPDARYTAQGRSRIALSQGELWARFRPSSQRAREKVEIHTPAGVATVEGTEFFIAVQPKAAERVPQVQVTVRDGKVQLANGQGAIEARAGEVLQATAAQAPSRQVEALALRFGRHYVPVPVKGTAQIPVDKPPFDLAKVVNYQQAASAFRLAGAEEQLRANGFVVLPGPGHADVAEAYRHLRRRPLPLVVTADVVLHLCRAQFTETLRSIEERVFHADLTALLRALLDDLDRNPPAADSPEGRSARALALTYLAVGLRALDDGAVLPPDVDRTAVAEVLAAMRRAEPQPVPVRLLGRAEDFAAYRPEGHYVRSERLRGYYAALTWFSQAPLLLPDAGRGQAQLVAPDQARRQALASALITRAWARAKLPDGRTARAAWERLYAVTAFHVGLSNDLGPQQYREALARVGGQLGEVGRLGPFEVELAKQDIEPHAFPQQPGPPRPANLLDELPPTAGFRLFGRRSTPDGYILGRLTWPAVGPAARQGQFTQTRTPQGQDVRGLPRGLDLMAVLGSSRARELLADLGDDAYRAGAEAPGYDSALEGLRRTFAGFDEVDWNRNLYWSWLYALQALLPERGSGYPPFMMTRAYQSKALTTALASWAHRRQDAVLYARPEIQVEMMKAARIGELAPPGLEKKSVPETYLEPLPELYARLLALTRMTRTGLIDMQVLDDSGRERLLGLERLLERLVAVAEKELADRPLDAAESAFLDTFVDQLQFTTGRAEGRLEKLGQELAAAQLAKDTKRSQAAGRALLDEGYGALDTRSVATVHLDTAGGEALQVATGYLDVGLFLWRRPGGELVLGAGPVHSYYEMRRPHNRVLSGGEWRRLLDAQPPARPVWTRDYLQAPKRGE